MTFVADDVDFDVTIGFANLLGPLAGAVGLSTGMLSLGIRRLG